MTDLERRLGDAAHTLKEAILEIELARDTVVNVDENAYRRLIRVGLQVQKAHIALVELKLDREEGWRADS